MKWTRLKIYLLPSIMYEIDKVTQVYINLINEIKRNNSNELMEEYQKLRENITKRIEEIDNFYEDNVNDPRIYNFEKGRIKLKKLLMCDPNPSNNFNFYSQNFRGLNFSYNKEYTQERTSPVGSKNFPITETNKITKGNYKISSSMCKKSEATSKSTVNKKFQSATKPLKKPDGYLDTVNSPKKEMKNIFSFNNIGNDEQWKEITFKIKLTEAEYILLMKEKSKNAFR